MSQKAGLLQLFTKRNTVAVEEAKDNGVKHPRQQVYFLRKDGYDIINTDKKNI